VPGEGLGQRHQVDQALDLSVFAARRDLDRPHAQPPGGHDVRGTLGDEHDVVERESGSDLVRRRPEEPGVGLEHAELARQCDAPGEGLEEAAQAEPPEERVVALPDGRQLGGGRRHVEIGQESDRHWLALVVPEPSDGLDRVPRSRSEPVVLLERVAEIEQHEPHGGLPAPALRGCRVG
jgi:hypothetical protein